MLFKLHLPSSTNFPEEYSTFLIKQMGTLPPRRFSGLVILSQGFPLGTRLHVAWNELEVSKLGLFKYNKFKNKNTDWSIYCAGFRETFGFTYTRIFIRDNFFIKYYVFTTIYCVLTYTFSFDLQNYLFCIGLLLYYI